jgi:hypothetical protein
MNRFNTAIPTTGVAFLLVEGGDERQVCKFVGGDSCWVGLHCWDAGGREKLSSVAALAALDPSIASVRRIGVVLDMEDSPAETTKLRADIEAALASTGKAVSFFVMPGGEKLGATETLCRKAVRNNAVAACVNALEQCTGLRGTTQARRDKGWLKAYLAMLPNS